MRCKSLGAALLLLLAGCSSVPTSSPVNPGIEIGNVDQAAIVTVIPQSPRMSMSPIEIVQGFIDASSSSLGNYAIARQYLSKLVSADWLPLAGIQVFETDLDLELISEKKVLGRGVSNLKVDGNYWPILEPAGKSSNVEFTLIQEEGQWRIIDPPSGVILTLAEFQRNYRIATLWFANQQLNGLVPDAVVLPNSAQPAGSLIRLLSTGASPWLNQSVKNFLTEENVLSIVTNESKISIDLDTSVLKLSERELSILVSQIAQTLQQLPNVMELSITTGEQLIELTDTPNFIDLSSNSWIQTVKTKKPNLIALQQNGDLINLSTNKLIKSWLNQYPQTKNLALNLSQSILASVASGSSQLRLAALNQSPRVINQPGNYSQVFFDSIGRLWFVETGSGNLYFQQRNALNQVAVRTVSQSKIGQVALSPDELRMAISRLSDVGSTLSLARVEPAGKTFALTDSQLILDTTGNIKEIDWITPTSVLVLISYVNQDEPTGLVLDIRTGRQQNIKLPAGTIHISADGYGDFVAIDSQNQIWQSVNSNWILIGNGVTAFYTD